MRLRPSISNPHPPPDKLSISPSYLFFSFKESIVIKNCIGPAVITLLFLVLTLWTWRKWPDLLRDFGRELYIPWQINAGKVLYKDIAYRHGPLSPYLNALWFNIFGVSLTTLAYCNLVIIFALLTIIFAQIKEACDRTTAVMACIVFLCTAAFPQFIQMGSFNFVCPYDHSLTHAILFSFLMIYCLSYFFRNDHSMIMLIYAGISCGLVFLTKAEIFGPLIVSASVGMVPIYHKSNAMGRRGYKYILIFIASMIFPIALFLAYFYFKMPFDQAMKGVLGDWAFMYGTRITNTYFIKNSLGTNKPLLNITWTLISFGILCFLNLTALRLDRVGCNKYLLPSWLILLLATNLILYFDFYPYAIVILNNFIELVYRPLFITTIISLSVIIYMLYSKKEYIMTYKMYPIFLLNVFGLLALSKIILNCRVYHYGFALAMTAMCANVILFIWLIPTFLRNEYGKGEVFRKLSILFLALVSIYALTVSNYFYSKKDYPIAEGTDTFLSYGPKYEMAGWAVNEAIKHIRESTSSGDSFLALPEGGMINYLTRRLIPIKYEAFTPGEFESFGEVTMLDAIKNAYPKFILLVHRGSKEFGVGYFGSINNGRQIMDWAKSNYTCLWKILNEPFVDDEFGIEMLRRNN